MTEIAVLVGSLRKESINRRLAMALQKLARGRLELSLVPLDAIPMFNEDLLSAGLPAPVAEFKQAVGRAGGLLFVTPEYNRAVPAVLKNAVDWGSRPYGQNVWAGKPGAVVGASPGLIGTAVAQAQLRNSLIVLDVALMGQPEIYFNYKEGMIGDDGEVTDEHAKALLSRFVDRFVHWVERLGESKASTQPN